MTLRSTAWTGGDVLSGDRRPTILAALLLLAFAVILAVPPLRESSELAPPGAAPGPLLEAWRRSCTSCGRKGHGGQQRHGL